MIIHKNIVQGSEPWLQLRLGKATCSNFNKVVTSKGKISESLGEYAFGLANQLLVYRQEETFRNSDMDHGNEFEPEARETYEEYSFNIIEQVGCIEKDKNILYSPDGLIAEDGILEIKCPKQKTHLKYLLDDKLPTKYVQQVQGGLLISGRKWCDFVSYCVDFKDSKKRLFCKRVYRDEEFISMLQTGLDIVIEKRDEILKKYEQL